MRPNKRSYTTVLIITAAVFILKAAAWNLVLPVESALAQTGNSHEYNEHEDQEERHTEPEDHEDHGNGDLHKEEVGDDEEEMVHISEAQIREFGIKTAPAGPGKIHGRAELTGEIVPDPDRLAHVVPRITGIVREVRKKTGDEVTKGGILAIIESRELADIKSDYLTADKRLELALANFKREKRLWEQEITPEQDFLDARTARAEAEIQRYRARQKLLALGFDQQYVTGLPEQQKTSLTRYNITSPMAGVVTRRQLAVGEIVGPQSDIFVVADLSKVWVNFTVYQKDLSAVTRGQAVTIAADKLDAQTHGVIDYVSPVIHEATRTATARVIVANPEGRWRPGLFVTGKVDTASRPADIVVPESAIQTIHNEPAVFVKRDHGFEPVPVKIGKRNSTQVEILSGLTPNTEIAVTRTFMLKAELNKEAIGGHSH